MSIGPKIVCADLPKTKEEAVMIRETPFVLPDAVGEAEMYITAVKENAPFEYCTIGGLNFEKAVFSADASLRQNEGKMQYPRFLARKLTKAQVDAIMIEAGKRYKKIPQRRNPNFVEGKPDDPEFFPAEIIKLSDYIICELVSNFTGENLRPQIIGQPIEPLEKEEDQGLAPATAIESKLMEQQKKAKDKDKK